MTQTTTELLTQVLDDALYEECESACEGISELHDRLIEGEPLPDQWRGKSDRDVVEAWWTSDDERRHKSWKERGSERYVVKLYCPNLLTSEPRYFYGSTPGEAYALAAKWCGEW